MSNTGIKTSYGTRKPQVSMAVNVPYMLKSIGSDHDKIVRMRMEQTYKELDDPTCVPSETDVSTMEMYLNDLERKANMIQKYLDKNQVSIWRFSRCDYFGFFLNDLDEFKSTCREIIQEDRDRIAINV